MSEFLGIYLKEARENKGLTIEDVAEETKIQKRYIEALEAEDFDELPGKTYIKGFLRNYAQVVGIDAREVIEKYEIYVGEQPIEKKENIEENKENVKDKLRIKNVIIAFALLLVFFIIIKILAGILPKEEITPLKSATSNPAKTVKKEKKIEEQKEIVGIETEIKKVDGEEIHVKRVEFDLLKLEGKGKSWLEVKDGEEFAFRGYIESGEIKEFKSKNILSIKIGDASNVEVIYNGENLGKLGEAKEVVKRAFD